MKAKWVGWLDDHSRHVMDLQAFPDERFPVIEASLKRAILKYGRPERILVDNGKVYSGHSFTLACSQLGIHKIHAGPYRPQTKGKIEKFFQLFRRRFLNEIEQLAPMELDKLNQLAAAWLDSLEPGALDPGRPLNAVRTLQITPRVSGTTRESRKRSAWAVARRIDELLSEPLGRAGFRPTWEGDVADLADD